MDGVATGGAGIGRGPDGRVVFVTGGLPGERVVARTVAEKRSWLSADLASVVNATPGRVDAPCPRVADGCGGCDWQHAAPSLQRQLRRAIVDDCLRRLAGIADTDIRPGPDLPPDHYRTTVRAAVRDGRTGFRQPRSADIDDIVLVGTEGCLIAHPLVDEVLIEGRFGDATEVTVRAGARTGERLVIVTPTADGVVVPDGVVVVGDDELRSGRQAHYHEEVGGRRLRISAQSFFQCRPDGAETLVRLATEAIDEDPRSRSESGVLLDAYCGVGLFGLLAGEGRRVIGVESSQSSARDAAHNYGPGGGHSVAATRFERWRPEPVEAAIADPARAGLGAKAVDRLAATGAGVVALVSCDPASLARDAKLLGAAGYDLDYVTVVDLFGHTSHIETVSRFVRR